MTNELSEKLRARALETLALVADVELQRKYQASVSSVDVPAELFNQWEDSYFPKNEQFRRAFSNAELDTLCRFDSVLNDVCARTPKRLPPLDEFIRTADWRRLCDAARVALVELQQHPDVRSP